MTQQIIVTTIMFLSGIICMVSGRHLRNESKLLSEKGTRTTGRVVGYDIGKAKPDSHGSGKISSFKKVDFLTRDGRTIQFGSRVGWFPNAIDPNVPVEIPVLYDPSCPERAIIDTFVERDLAWIIFIILGVSLLLFCLIASVF